MEATEGSLGPCDSGASGCRGRAAREVRGRARVLHQPKAPHAQQHLGGRGRTPGRSAIGRGARVTPTAGARLRPCRPRPRARSGCLQPRFGSRRAPARSPRVSRSLARLWDGGLQPAERADSGRRRSPRAAREEARSPKTRTA